jgi:hypothetical protein
MIIEHSVEGSARMERLADNVTIRMWLTPERFITIFPTSDGKAVLVCAFATPGGFGYGQPIQLQSNNSNSVAIV